MVDKRSVEELEKQLDQYYMVAGLSSVTEDPDTGLLNVSANKVTPRSKSSLQFQLGTVRADFSCNNLGLRTLEGCPLVVTGNFACHTNNLVSLRGCPRGIGELNIGGGFFTCAFNQLENFEHMDPNFRGYFVGIDQGIPQTLTSVSGLPPHARLTEITYQPHLPLLSLLELDNVTIREPNNGPTMHDITDILGEFRGQGQGAALECAARLASAGYKENAQW